jgi:hypothetical protein
MAWRPLRLSVSMKLLIAMVGRRTIPAIDNTLGRRFHGLDSVISL